MSFDVDFVSRYRNRLLAAGHCIQLLLLVVFPPSTQSHSDHVIYWAEYARLKPLVNGVQACNWALVLISEKPKLRNKLYVSYMLAIF